MAAAPPVFQVVGDGLLVYDTFGVASGTPGTGNPLDRFSIYNSPFDNFFVYEVNGSADTPPSTTGSGDPFDRFTIYNSQFDNFFVFNVNGTAGATPTPTPTGQESIGIGLAAAPRPPVDFVMNGGYMAGVRVPRFATTNRMIKQTPNQWRKQPEDVELREMMGIYAMWKRS